MPQVIVTAHAGDSDVCLIRFTEPQNASQKSVILFAKWLTKEHTMHNNEERARPIMDGGILADREGLGNLRYKVKSGDGTCYCSQSLDLTSSLPLSHKRPPIP